MKHFLPLLLLLCLGCATVTPPKTLSFKERPKTPGRMETYWQTYTQPNLGGDMPLRSVGGRIHFYGEKNASEPIKVNGDLTIFLFDANDPVPLHSVPVQQAVYKKEVLSAFHRKDSMGINGYDFVVPVDELGSEERDLQVIAVFHERQKPGKPARVINSELVIVRLPGPKRQSTTFDDGAVIDLASGRGDESSGIALASYQRPSQTEPDSRNSRQRNIETIQLPPRYTQAYQNDPQTGLVVNPDTPRLEVVGTNTSQPPLQENVNVADLKQNTNDWPKIPSPLQSIAQRGLPTSNDRKFRIDSNTNPKPNDNDKLVYEEVSKSGVSTKMWVQ